LHGSTFSRYCRFDRPPTCDEQIDAQTQGDSIYRASIASRDKNVAIDFELTAANNNVIVIMTLETDKGP